MKRSYFDMPFLDLLFHVVNSCYEWETINSYLYTCVCRPCHCSVGPSGGLGYASMCGRKLLFACVILDLSFQLIFLLPLVSLIMPVQKTLQRSNISATKFQRINRNNVCYFFKHHCFNSGLWLCICLQSRAGWHYLTIFYQ